MRKASLLMFVLLSFIQAAAIPISENLFFVGEDQEILTIASGRPEMPKRAPAVADVITRKTLEDRGYRTLREVLSDEPGFMLTKQEMWSKLFLRGVPSGALFLFDGVPLTTDSTKSIYLLDEELSLDYVKRVEIIRGPGSVLWGPDAFSGIVNIVPLSGKDINGLKFKLLSGTPLKDKKFSVVGGFYKDGWDVMGAFSSYAKRSSSGKKQQEFYEIASKIEYRKLLSLTGRISWEHNRARLRYRSIKWTARDEKPLVLIKGELNKQIGKFRIRATGSYIYWNIKKENQRFSWGYDNHICLGTIFIDRELFDGSGLLTFGGSIRRNIAKKAPITIRGFYPEYINSPFLSPLVDKKDFDTTLKSLFAQYIHHLKEWEFWIGLRYDKNTDYKATISYNTGAAFFPNKHLTLKISLGSAFRTPFAGQFLKRSSIRPEQIDTANLILSYKNKGLEVHLVPFFSRIRHHVSQDAYGGFSRESTQHILGIEASASFSTDNLKIWGTLTALHHYGDKEKFKVLDYILYMPPEITYVYSMHKRDFEFGPSSFGALGITYNPSKKLLLSIVTRYRGAYTITDLKTGRHHKYKHLWSTDVYARLRLNRSTYISLKIENLFSHRPYKEGIFDRFKDAGTRIFLILKIQHLPKP